ncbi:MAG TPA: DUF308 domain-containing protein [Baekduia sp.]|nr:DUF308 domain-containing protein [Baekduia sp.]
MSARLAAAPLDVSPTPRRIARLRAVVALVWAAALAIAAGDDAGPELSAGLAALVTAYPVIDVVASLTEPARGGDRSRLLQVNAAIGTLAVAALAGAAFGSDVSAVLAVFGTWAFVSGAIQLANAVHRRRAGTRELPMIVSGALSALAGISFIASSGGDDPSLTPLAGYAAFGAALFLLWAYRTRTSA